MHNIYFSIIVPCYNSVKFIKKTLDSIIMQDLNDYEVIIVDDGSDDNLNDVLYNYRNLIIMKVLRQDNKGPAAARNSGISISRGKYIAFLDADDYWESNKLSKCKIYLEKTKSQVIYHNEYEAGGKDNVLLKLFRVQYNNFYDLFFRGNAISTSTVIIERTIFDKIGYFNEDKSFIGIEDYDMWLRILIANIKINYMSDYLSTCVTHSENISKYYEYLNRVEYLLIYYSKEIDLLKHRHVLNYKIRLLRFFYSKTKKALIMKKYEDIYLIIYDIFVLIINIQIFISKKKILYKM